MVGDAQLVVLLSTLMRRTCNEMQVGNRTHQNRIFSRWECVRCPYSDSNVLRNYCCHSESWRHTLLVGSKDCIRVSVSWSLFCNRHIEVCVCSHPNAIPCYSFPWQPSDAEQIIEISLDQMPYDYGIVMVDSSLVFTPRLGPCMEDMKLMPVRCTLLQNECLHLVAASKVVNATDGTQRKEASYERDWFTEVDRIWKDCGVHIEPRQIRGKSYKPTELILPVCLESFRQQFQHELSFTKLLILKSFTGNLAAMRRIDSIYVDSDNAADLPGVREPAALFQLN